MKLITSDEQLRSLIPNVLLAVRGETPLIDKLQSFIEDAEQWLSDEFTTADVLDIIAGADDDDKLRTVASKAVVMEAFHNAIPFLDLVLTPNGFGIVSNQNVAPASKERVERLRESAMALRDEYLESFIPLLYSIEEWRDTELCAFFGSTMFPNISIVRNFEPKYDRWIYYLTLRAQMIPVEQSIIDFYLGQEQMDVFRNEVQSNTIQSVHRNVIASLQSVEIAMLKAMIDGKPCDRFHRALDSIVNIIRNDETNFPEWHNSKVKELFSPKVYENKKEDKGYWF